MRQQPLETAKDGSHDNEPPQGKQLFDALELIVYHYGQDDWNKDEIQIE